MLTLIVTAGWFNQALAQKNNLSDWNVPPPVLPGNTAKGNATGKNGKSILLTLSDIKGVALPVAPPVQLPVLAAIATTPPLINPPGQPAISDAGNNLPEIPSPETPDAPPLPKQNYQDALTPAVTDLPIPTEPELPVFPKEPSPSAQKTTVKGSVPLLPDVLSLPSPSIPSGNDFPVWAIPDLEEHTSFKLITPVKAKAVKPRGRAAKKSTPNY
ncbi:hypothetical protein [Mucilaginibacter pineti]|nr:hypothetical protein [Mucilaginibacter pineti]